jgi:hypothetical protein
MRLACQCRKKALRPKPGHKGATKDEIHVMSVLIKGDELVYFRDRCWKDRKIDIR